MICCRGSLPGGKIIYNRVREFLSSNFSPLKEPQRQNYGLARVKIYDHWFITALKEKLRGLSMEIKAILFSGKSGGLLLPAAVKISLQGFEE